jgi:phage shock protein A
MQENERLTGEWQKKAELALTRDQEDLAREALKRKNTFSTNADTYRAQWAAQTEMVAKLKDQLRLLESKYQSALSQKDVLIARRRRAQAQAQVSQTISGMPRMDATAEIDRFERRIRGEEAKAEALTELGTDSLESQFDALERDAGVEDELAALKAKVQGTAAAGTTTTASRAGEGQRARVLPFLAPHSSPHPRGKGWAWRSTSLSGLMNPGVTSFTASRRMVGRIPVGPRSSCDSQRAVFSGWRAWTCSIPPHTLSTRIR